MKTSDRLALWILKKRGLRSDRLWTSPRIFKNLLLRRIPVALDTWSLSKSQYWDRSEMAPYYTDRLRAIATTAEKLPYWRSRFKEAAVDPRTMALADLSKLRVISKKEFVGHERTEYVDESRLARATLDFTSGSTGVPFEFLYDWSAELRSFGICERMFKTDAGDRYPIVALRARHKPGFAFFRHEFFFLQGRNSLKHRYDDLLSVCQKYPNGFILYGYPSAILEVAELKKEKGGAMNVKAAIATGEPLGPEQRSFIESSLHTRFFLNYASREMGWLGYECEYHSMHLNDEWAYVEILDEKGLPVPAGVEGKVAITLFDNVTMPLIRYDGGDRGTIDTVPCRCGRRSPTIVVSGRANDLIELADGRTVPLINLSASLDRQGKAFRQFQIVQKGPLDFTLRVVAAPEFELRKDRIRDGLIRLLHPHVRITWELVDEIPSGKSGKAVYFVKAIG